MIRLLYDTTIAGTRFGTGSILDLAPNVERDLVLQGNAIRRDFAYAAMTPVRLNQKYMPVTRASDNATDTSYAVLATVTLPGGAIDANGKLWIEASWDLTSSVSTKTVAIDFGGITIATAPLTTTPSYTLFRAVQYLNSLNSQHCLNVNGYGGGTATSMTKDTSLDVEIVFKCRWSANVASENITLLGYSVWYYPGS